MPDFKYKKIWFFSFELKWYEAAATEAAPNTFITYSQNLKISWIPAK